MDRQTLHRMIERLPDESLEQAARRLGELLEGRIHPAVLAAWLAPADDEVLTDEESAALDEARDDARRGEVVDTETLRRELGL